jgi:hypothetical protein
MSERNSASCYWIARKAIPSRRLDEVYLSVASGMVFEELPLRFEKMAGNMLALRNFGVWELIRGDPIQLRLCEAGASLRGTLSAKHDRLRLMLDGGVEWRVRELSRICLPFHV